VVKGIEIIHECFSDLIEKEARMLGKKLISIEDNDTNYVIFTMV
jgi:hypothetical protein